MTLPSRVLKSLRAAGVKPTRLRAPSKYHAEPETVDNIRFASKREAKRYSELKLLQRANLISDLHWQVAYVLSAMNFGTGEMLPVGTYVADFTYTEKGQLVVEDVKGMAGGLPMFRWKAKHFRIQYGISITEVR